MPDRKISKREWRHVVCRYSIQNDFYPDLQNRYPGLSSNEWEPSHMQCRHETFYEPDPQSATYRESERMTLRCLRTCRQIYVEASQILWQTTTFAFHDSISLHAFLEVRTPLQLSMLRKLHLRFDYVTDNVTTRRRSLSCDAMQAMSAIQSLTLIIQDEVDQRLMLQDETSQSTYRTTDYIEADLYGLSNLQPRFLEVHVLPSYPYSNPRVPWYLSQQSPSAKKWRQKIAESVMDFLSSSGGSRPFIRSTLMC